MADSTDESERDPSGGQSLSNSNSAALTERHLMPDPDDSEVLEVGEITSDEEETSNDAVVDASEPPADATLAESRLSPNRVTPVAPPVASTLRTGGLRGPDDDIRRLHDMNRAAAVTATSCATADGWGAMFPSSSVGK